MENDIGTPPRLALVSHRLPRDGDVFRCPACDRTIPVGDSPYAVAIEPVFTNYVCAAISEEARAQAVQRENDLLLHELGVTSWDELREKIEHGFAAITGG